MASTERSADRDQIRCYSRDIVRYNDARAKTRLTAAVALAVAFWVSVVGAEWALSGDNVPSAHGAHALATAPHTEFAVVTEHPHLQDESTPVAPDTFAHAVLPRATTVLAALGLIAATATLAASWRQAALAAARGPPRPLAGVLTGRLY